MAGDSLLVGFNVPLAQLDAPIRAVLSAVEMMTHFKPLASEWQRVYGAEVGVGFGINRGGAIVGNVGAPSHMAYTLIGDAVNVAARLTQLAGAGEILMSIDVMESPALMQAFGAEKMPPVSLKGRDTPVPYFRITDNPDLEPALAKWKVHHVMQVAS
jgi:adenylate cyclase